MDPNFKDDDETGAGSGSGGQSASGQGSGGVKLDAKKVDDGKKKKGCC